MRGKRPFGEGILVFVFLGVLCLALLAVVLLALSGESRRSRLSLEHEAEEAAMALLMMSMGGAEAPDLQGLERRVAGFGLYREDGTPITRAGSAPEVLSLDERATRPGSPGLQPAQFRLHPERGTVTLLRWVGRPPRQPGMGAHGGPGMPPMMPMTRARPEVLFLELHSAQHWTRASLYRSAGVVAPLIIVGLLTAMALLYRRNASYRRRLAEQEQLARLGEASRTLSHEIKNPLSAIRIQTAYLKRTLPAERRSELQLIEEEVARLGLLTDRVGEFLRDPRGEPQSVELQGFIGELVLRFAGRVRFVSDGGPPAPIVRFDRQRLRSVLENLIRNASEAVAPESGAPGGDAQGSVEVELAVRASHVEIAVRDRGPGIPEDMMEKVFDPFYTTKTQGSGVGLAVSRRFVEAAGGRLLLANRPGGGLEARVILPRVEA